VVVALTTEKEGTEVRVVSLSDDTAQLTLATDDDDSYDGGGRYQRRRFEEPPAIKLRKQVVSIAEAPHRRVDEDIMNSAKTIADNYFDTDLTNTFLDIAVSLTLEQPLKIPFIAAIVLQTNTQKPEFTEEVLKKVGDALQQNINTGCWREVKLLLRFLACLQGLFMGDGVFPFLEELFTRAAELQTASNEDVSCTGSHCDHHC